jgi:hypothetical protein
MKKFINLLQKEEIIFNNLKNHYSKKKLSLLNNDSTPQFFQRHLLSRDMVKIFQVTKSFDRKNPEYPLLDFRKEINSTFKSYGRPITLIKVSFIV